MIDSALLRDRLDEVRARLLTRGASDVDFEKLRALDQDRRQILPVLENQRRQQKEIGDRIAETKRKGEETSTLLSASRMAGDRIRELEGTLSKIEEDRRALLLRLPNLPHESVPVGNGPEENQEVRCYGKLPEFSFTPRPHWELGSDLGILDFERASKLSGARFSVLVGAGARLARALIDFMLDLHTREHGYTEVEPPFLTNAATLEGTGQLPKFADDLFKVEEWDLYLVPTAEVPLTNLHREEILDGSVLPLKYTAYTPCFRSEAGSYGADVRGLIRQHQFDKVELVKIATPESSYDELESLTADAEQVLKRLDLPFRTVLLCTGDMGFAAAKTYDIEVWLPSQQMYREISSCSNTEAFQARRAGIRFRPGGKGKAELVHTLNGSGLAVGRTLIAILENNQQRDGSVVIPPVLRSYMNGLEVIERVR